MEKVKRQLFNQEARQILRKSDRGKGLYHLIEEAPADPKMRGLPKVHKDLFPSEAKKA